MATDIQNNLAPLQTEEASLEEKKDEIPNNTDSGICSTEGILKGLIVNQLTLEQQSLSQQHPQTTEKTVDEIIKENFERMVIQSVEQYKKIERVNLELEKEQIQDQQQRTQITTDPKKIKQSNIAILNEKIKSPLLKQVVLLTVKKFIPNDSPELNQINQAIKQAKNELKIEEDNTKAKLKEMRTNVDKKVDKAKEKTENVLNKLEKTTNKIVEETKQIFKR